MAAGRPRDAASYVLSNIAEPHDPSSTVLASFHARDVWGLRALNSKMSRASEKGERNTNVDLSGCDYCHAFLFIVFFLKQPGALQSLHSFSSFLLSWRSRRFKQVPSKLASLSKNMYLTSTQVSLISLSLLSILQTSSALPHPSQSTTTNNVRSYDNVNKPPGGAISPRVAYPIPNGLNAKSIQIWISLDTPPVLQIQDEGYTDEGPVTCPLSFPISLPPRSTSSSSSAGAATAWNPCPSYPSYEWTILSTTTTNNATSTQEDSSPQHFTLKFAHTVKATRSAATVYLKGATADVFLRDRIMLMGGWGYQAVQTGFFYVAPMGWDGDVGDQGLSVQIGL